MPIIAPQAVPGRGTPGPLCTLYEVVASSGQLCCVWMATGSISMSIWTYTAMKSKSRGHPGASILSPSSGPLVFRRLEMRLGRGVVRVGKGWKRNRIGGGEIKGLSALLSDWLQNPCPFKPIMIAITLADKDATDAIVPPAFDVSIRPALLSYCSALESSTLLQQWASQISKAWTLTTPASWSGTLVAELHEPGVAEKVGIGLWSCCLLRYNFSSPADNSGSVRSFPLRSHRDAMESTSEIPSSTRDYPKGLSLISHRLAMI
ncbi:hypothetical protein QBC36DRAFT_356315 [Triangularia setosa]|uniref:Uncharacterized protein n=1 Tax=Triangularia setosa TaxID=2587417 RepID=A0AAN7AC81_9PEZI|nr:hypothetical protein QBC36DRAFT_356315 [Podospora setosa]